MALDCKKIQPVHPKGDQSWVFIGGTDVEAKAPILWPPDAKSWLIGKDSDAGKHWRREEKRAAEHEMVGWHYWLNGHEFKQTLGDSEVQGNLACCSSGGLEQLGMTYQLDNNDKEVIQGIVSVKHWVLFSEFCSII